MRLLEYFQLRQNLDSILHTRQTFLHLGLFQIPRESKVEIINNLPLLSLWALISIHYIDGLTTEKKRCESLPDLKDFSCEIDKTMHG